MIVVTGGIGAGKSTVLKLLREMGAICADADEISREICRKGTPALAEIARHFGSDVLTDDGELNRPALARFVFSNPNELAWLNALLHPMILAELERLDRQAAPQPLFAAIPLWHEAKWRPASGVKAVVAVWCTPEMQLERLRGRGWDDEEIRRRTATQISMDEKRRNADYVLETTGTIQELREKCQGLLQLLQKEGDARK